MDIAIIGAGYVGLVSGACLAEAGHDVVVTDSSADRIDMLNRGEMPIFEPGLDAMVAENVAADRLIFSKSFDFAVGTAEVVFICVGTPQGASGSADLSAVRNVAHGIGRVMRSHPNQHFVIVNKSTVPVGTADEVRAIIAAEMDRLVRGDGPAATFTVVSNPEFLREGAAIADFMHPDRVVIGVGEAADAAVMRRLYKPITERVIEVDTRTAELVKYAANAFLAMKITFINEMADLCEEVGADIDGVARGIGSDRRIGPDFLRPGPGYGGSCFPKDTMALVATAEKAGVPLSLVDATIAVNDARKRAMGHRVIDAMGGEVENKTVALLGLTFKAGTDDMRDSPAIDVIDVLQEAGACVQAYDPEGMANAVNVTDGVVMSATPFRACLEADAVVIVTDWPEFRSLDLYGLARLMKGRAMVDLRNIIDPVAAARAGFILTGIGRPS